MGILPTRMVRILIFYPKTVKRDLCKTSIFIVIEAHEKLARRNTISISRTKATAGEAEVAAQILSATKSSVKRRPFAEVSKMVSEDALNVIL